MFYCFLSIGILIRFKSYLSFKSNGLKSSSQALGVCAPLSPSLWVSARSLSTEQLEYDELVAVWSAHTREVTCMTFAIAPVALFTSDVYDRYAFSRLTFSGGSTSSPFRQHVYNLKKLKLKAFIFS